jgi:hypothetical protein
MPPTPNSKIINTDSVMPSSPVKDETPPMKTEDEPPSKKPRKDDDERVHRAALLLIKSQMLSVPQVR